MNAAIDLFCEWARPQLPEVWYHVYSKEYYTPDKDGDWIPLAEAQFKRVLKKAGLSGITPKDEPLSPVDVALLEIQQERNVHNVGPLAGYDRGVHAIGPLRALVTSSPKIIEPQPGDWPVLGQLIVGLFGPETGAPVQHLYGWLKVGYESLRDGTFRPGQALVMCGPADCGKSLFQKLITVILGGRVAKPYQAMTGGSQFNADLFGAEHLMVEDENPSTDIRSRRNFGTQIKNVTVNDDQRLHAKHKDAVMVKPFWRMTTSINDEAENLMVLPPIDESLVDKMTILRAARTKMPMPTATGDERVVFWDTLVSEMPAFLNFLCEWQIPEDIQSDRFGVSHYHDSGIVAELGSMDPEERLLELIVSHFGSFPANLLESDEVGRYIEVTQEYISQALTDSMAPCSFEARRLLQWNGACGTYLGRLAKKHPDVVQNKRTPGQRLWRIRLPDCPEDTG